ncbi:Hypothetical predicted protein [Mytilus galloprovincialis]|uniref:AIG1-type G domain-containing protein n=1 Tax=Mytilus galloprovincialis TaxID=29158 RepID=A0A8B6C1J3_MYTGA|nr:Hypothetical predicted protein [Mytilus galloprovincialis]
MPRILNQFKVKSATWKRLTDDGIETIVGTTDSDNGKYCISSKPPELQIMNSDENNRGKYICHLSDGIEERIADVFLDCPKISVDEKKILAAANEKKSLNYYISTSLPAVKSLIKNQNEEEDILMPTDENDGFMSLEIQSTCLNDKGTYVCTATNSLGTGRASTELYVGERPVIEVSEMSYITQRQQSVTLLCEVSSDLPLTKLLWEKNFSLIEKNNERKFSGGNIQCPSLTIKDAEPTDKGSYVCYATNDIGTTQSSSIDLQFEETVLNDSFRAPYYTGKDTDSEPHFAQVVLGKWEAEYARAKSQHLIDEELRIVLIGKTGAGKSATCNMIAGEEIFESEMAAGSVTKSTQFKRVTVRGKPILLIDTPGILDSEVNQEEIEKEISKCVLFGAPGIHSILFVMPIGRFTEEDIKVIETFLGYFGREKMEHHVIVVFTFGDRLTEGKKTIEDYLQKAPERIRCFIERCKNRYVVFNNKLNKFESFQQVQGLIHFITSHKYEKVLSYYTDKLFEAAEKNLREKEDEIQRTLEDMYNTRVEEMQREFDKIKEQITNLYESGVQVEAAKECEKQLQELKIRSEEELSETKQLYESRMSKVRDEARLGAESDSVMLNFNTQQSPGNEN